ncbi:MAG TPA: DUF1579 family protein [Acidimicrobiales bacterium]|jgi:hypothetical protein
MTPTDAPAWTTFAAALAAEGPHPEHRVELMTFGQFVGSWAMDVRLFDQAGQLTTHTPATWTFAWVLDGRAIQDVLVFGAPDGGTPTGRGSTLRYFDPRADLWHVYWLGSATGTIVRLHGSPSADDIVLEGDDVDGSPLRWMFRDVTADRFHWTGHASDDGGRSWRLEQEMDARRLTDSA